MNETRSVIVVGGGAAGFFAAITCASANPQSHPLILEKSVQLLTKVRISGGGRCNVTHSCFDPAQLVKNYPRGEKALRGPFSRFQPTETVQWFESRGVVLKTEPDGRMFPITDSSQTIIDCLLAEAKKTGVEIRTKTGVQAIEPQATGFKVTLTTGEQIICEKVLLATGSNAVALGWAQQLGHTIEPQVPSLFTFNVPDSPLLDIAGIAVDPVQLRIKEIGLEQSGPMLITHWGFSGPAVLKLSAWGARLLHDLGYNATLVVNWLPQYNADSLFTCLQQVRDAHPNRLISTESPVALPRNLWKKFVEADQKWAALSNKALRALSERLLADSYNIRGKTTYKEEFVTCGGICLDEVNFKTMESRICPGLYFAGEVLDIDGVTGGFNFQNAWTTGYLAGTAMA